MSIIINIICFIAGAVACYFALRYGVKSKMKLVKDILDNIETLGENGYDKAKGDIKALKKKIGME